MSWRSAVTSHESACSIRFLWRHSTLVSASTVTAVPSATVMILRDGPGGLEVLLGRRRQGRAFGEAHVFPGGVVDSDDARAATRCRGLTAADASLRMGVASGALDYWVTAVREVFEETGLAFFTSDAMQAESLPSLRESLVAGSVLFSDLCSDQGWHLRVDALHYVAHWITPEIRPVRFDTRFFIAELPAGQDAAHDGHELTDSAWLTPAEALSRMRAGNMKLAPPTMVELERLSHFADKAAALSWARPRWRQGVAAVLPIVERHGQSERVNVGPEFSAAMARARGEST